MVDVRTVIKISHLKSRQVFQQISPNGKKLVLGSSSVSWLGKLFEATKVIIGFVSSAILRFLRSINFKKIWQWLVSAFHVLWNFNWLATDKELNEQIRATWLSIEERMFGLVGKGLGYLVCGVAPTAPLAVINLPLAAFLLKNLGDEAVPELIGELQGFFSMVGRATAQWLLLKGYMMIRRILKAPLTPFNLVWHTILRLPQDAISKWGEKEGEHWSFAKGMQQFRQSLGERMENNLEEFTDEFSDACIEAGFALAGGLDEWFGLDGMTKGIFDLFGENRTISYTPDKDNKEETYVITGREEFVKQQVQSINNTAQTIGNREIGVMLPSLGNWDEIPITESNGIEVMFEFFNYEQPPYWTKDRRNNVVRSRLTVPNCERTKISWENIKKVFGSNIAFTKGNIRSEVHLTNGRLLVCYTKTEQEAEDLLKKLASFTNEQIVYPIDIRGHRGWEKRVGYNLQTVGSPQYLSSITICNWEKLNKFERQKGLSPSERKKQVVKLKIHYETKPNFWDDKLREALSVNLLQ